MLRRSISALLLAIAVLFGGFEPASAAPISSAALLGSSVHIGAIAANKRRGTVVAPPPVTVAYDTSIGASVDANGFTSLPLHSGAHRYFVKPTGSDANTCTQAENPATPKATMNAGLSCITNGEGDQVLLAEGATFNEVMPYVGNHTKDGFSATYPTVISSYDPADPTNEAKIGMGHQRNARPLLIGNTHTDVNDGVISGGSFAYIAIKGLHFEPGNLADQSMQFRGDGNYLLFENNIYSHIGLSFDVATYPATPTTQKIIVRNNSFSSMWQDGGDGRTGGLYVSGYVNPTVEDNVFYHCGWNTASNRDFSGTDFNGDGTATPEFSAYLVAGGPNVLGHSYYIQTDTTGAIVRRNLSMEGAGDGGIARGDSTFTENLLIDNPAAMGLGGGPQYDIDRPNGVSFDASYNAILGTSVNGVYASHYIEWGINTTDGQPGSRVHHNLMVRSVDPAMSNTSGFSNNAAKNQPSYVEYDHNLIWNWVNQSVQAHSAFESCGAFAAQCHTAYDYNNWDGLALGTNTNSTATSFPNAFTAASLYAALGYADRNAFITYAINHPEAHIQRTARSLLFSGYGVAAPTDTTAPTLSAATATTTGSSTADISVTTNEANGILYYDVTTSATPPHPTQIKFGLLADGTAAAKAGSIAISSTGAKTANLSSLSPGTYYAHFVHEDTAGNKSSVASSASFTIASLAATWDSGHSSTDYTLSNGNLTATRSTVGSGWALVRASPTKANGTILITINSLGTGGAGSYVGFGLGDETANLGASPSGHSIGYAQGGGIAFAGANVDATAGSYAAGDVIKMVKSGANVSFFKQTGGTGSFVQQGATIDTSSPDYGLGTVLAGAVYPAVSNHNSSGAQFTIDASGW
jgi:hypothetical protein